MNNPLSYGLMFVIGTLVSGCESVTQTLSGVSRPTAQVGGVGFGGLSTTGMVMTLSVEIDNPYPFALPLAGMDYRLGSGGEEIVSGSLSELESIPARGKGTVAVPMNLNFATMLSAAGGVKPGGVVPYEAALTLTGGTVAGLLGGEALRLPLSKTGEVPVPIVPEVSVSTMRWTKLSLTEAAAQVEVSVNNPNTFAMAIQKMGAALEIGGVNVAQLAMESPSEVPVGETATMRIPISFKPLSLGPAVLGVLRGDGAAYRMVGELAAATRYGDLNMPFDSSGRVPFER